MAEQRATLPIWSLRICHADAVAEGGVGKGLALVVSHVDSVQDAVEQADDLLAVVAVQVDRGHSSLATSTSIHWILIRWRFKADGDWTALESHPTDRTQMQRGTGHSSLATSIRHLGKHLQ